MYLDCIHANVRGSGAVRVKALYVAIGVNLDGIKEVLGLWMAQTEEAKFWLHVVTELKNRGVADIFIACVDGLKGFHEVIEAVFPQPPPSSSFAWCTRCVTARTLWAGSSAAKLPPICGKSIPLQPRTGPCGAWLSSRPEGIHPSPR